MPQNNELKRREISNNTLVYTCFSVPSNRQHSCVHFWPKELTCIILTLGLPSLVTHGIQLKRNK